jgi:hypothetical protein
MQMFPLLLFFLLLLLTLFMLRPHLAENSFSNINT